MPIPTAWPPVPKAIVTRVSRICASLPETSSSAEDWGHAFRIRRRVFCYLLAPANPEGMPVPMVILHADPDEREVLVAIGHPYFAPRGGGAAARVGVVVGDHTDWTELRELLTESYRILAPKKLAALLP